MKENDTRKKINLIYQFCFVVPGMTTESGINNAKPIVRKCEDFADNNKILCMCDHVGAYNHRLNIRVQFNIQGTQDIVLPKVSSLFAFAALEKLDLANQFFLPE
jgi:hypothetical protein